MRARMTQILCAGAGAIIFSILLERLTIAGIIAGVCCGWLFQIVIRPVGNASTKPLRGMWLIRYAMLLLRDMATSTLRQARAVLFHAQHPPTIVHLPPHAAERGRVLVANSITLTPGTITLEETAQEYVILCAQAPTNAACKAALSTTFEARLHHEEDRV